jgi:hypothetical protein
MNQVGVTSLIALALWAGDAAAEQITPQPVDGKIEWVYDYARGKELARQTGKPLFVVFRCER